VRFSLRTRVTTDAVGRAFARFKRVHEICRLERLDRREDFPTNAARRSMRETLLHG